MSAALDRRVRTARKVWRCVNAHARKVGNPAAAMCRMDIHPGEQYVEGDRDPYSAGGFGHDAICMACAKAGAA